MPSLIDELRAQRAASNAKVRLIDPRVAMAAKVLDNQRGARARANMADLTNDMRSRIVSATRMGDYDPVQFRRVVAASASVSQGPGNLGPTNSPIDQPGVIPTAEDLLRQILEAILRAYDTAMPIVRSQSVDSSGETLDWSMVGEMARVVIRNKGPSSVWISFDTNGAATQAFSPSNQSFELQAQESLSLPQCRFERIGCRCAVAGTGTVHAVAFQNVSGAYAGSIG